MFFLDRGGELGGRFFEGQHGPRANVLAVEALEPFGERTSRDRLAELRQVRLERPADKILALDELAEASPELSNTYS